MSTQQRQCLKYVRFGTRYICLQCVNIALRCSISPSLSAGYNGHPVISVYLHIILVLYVQQPDNEYTNPFSVSPLYTIERITVTMTKL